MAAEAGGYASGQGRWRVLVLALRARLRAGKARTGGAALVAVLLAAGVAAAQSSAPQRVYVTMKELSASSSRINAFAKDGSTGALSPVPGSPFDARLDGAAISVDALGRFLFVANPAHNNVSMFAIDPDTGALAEVPASPFAIGPYFTDQAPAEPVALATEPTGRFLFVGYRNSGDSQSGAVGVFTIDSQQPALVPFPEGGIRVDGHSPEALATDPRGMNLYVAYGMGYGSNFEAGLLVYRIDPLTGRLFPAAAGSAGDVLRGGMALDPAGRFVYIGHGMGTGFIAMWRLSPVDGLPVTSQQMWLDPPGFPVAMAIESTGRYLYVWTGQGELRIFSIDPVSGELTEVPGSPQPLVLSPYIAPDPQSPYLYSLDVLGVHAFSADPDTGLLTEIPGSPFPLSPQTGPRGIVVSGTSPFVQPISGPHPQFEIDAVVFPNTTVGTTRFRDVRLVNSGSQNLFIDTAAFEFAGAHPNDFSQTNNCPVALPPGEHCTVTLAFVPTAGGTREATLLFVTGGSGSQPSVALSGVGIAPQPAVTLVPGSLEFEGVFGGAAPDAQDVTVTNSGTAVLLVSSVLLSGSNPNDFSFSQNCTAAPVAVGGHCTVRVTFHPLAAGQRTAQILLTDNAPGSPREIALTGSATPGFTLTTNGSSPAAVIAPGQTAEYELQLVPAPEFSGLVQLACSGAPPGTSCNVPPSVQVANGDPVSFLVTVTTTGGAGIPMPPGRAPFSSRPLAPPFHIVFFWLLLITGLVLGLRRRGAVPVRARACPVLFLAFALAACSLSGCSSAGSSFTGAPSPPPSSQPPANPPANTTPSGTFTLTVTATAGSFSQPVQLTLTVQ